MLRRKVSLKPSAPPRRSSGRISRKEPIIRTKRARWRNTKRHDREWVRAYHSVERVEFVKALPCVVTGEPGPCVNAHTLTGGTSRKGDYTTIIPVLASVHDAVHHRGWAWVVANDRRWTTAQVRRFLAFEAANTEAAWQRHA